MQQVNFNELLGSNLKITDNTGMFGRQSSTPINDFLGTSNMKITDRTGLSGNENIHDDDHLTNKSLKQTFKDLWRRLTRFVRTRRL